MRKKGIVIWLFGLSGSGKSTLAEALDSLLSEKGYCVKRLDGDSLRRGINSDLGYSEADRQENIRRASEIARLFSEAGMVTICSFISPSKKSRETAQRIIGEEAFYDIFLDCSLETCISRDPKGLYQKALNGEIKEFTGIDSQFERPEKSFFTIKSDQQNIEETASKIIMHLIPVLKQEGAVDLLQTINY